MQENANAKYHSTSPFSNSKMANSPLDRFLDDFRALRDNKRRLKRKSNSEPPPISKEMAEIIRERDQRARARPQGTTLPLTMFSDGNTSTGSDNTTSGPDPALDSSSSSSRPDITYLQVPTPDGGNTVKIKRPRRNTIYKSDQCAKITADSERARAETETAGVHVKDFATGYATDVSDVKMK